MLEPIIPDDWLGSHSAGPIEVYRSKSQKEIFIDDIITVFSIPSVELGLNTTSLRLTGANTK
ncbi:hypothetical protein ACFL2C_03165 [Patescibacteria group bacterium]